MQIRIGGIPDTPTSKLEADTYHRISGPSLRISYVLAWGTGFLFFFGLYVFLILIAIVADGSGTQNTQPQTSTPWFAVILTLIVYIPAHELLHLLFHPQNGRSDQSTLAIWPKKLRFGVYYEGCMSRTRWFVMRMAPLIGLCLIPFTIISLANWLPINHAVVISMQVLMLVNCIGSGGDVVAVMYVARHVPAGSDLCFEGGRAYWRK